METATYRRAVALAARKLRSAAELRAKLIGEDFAEDQVDAALVRLAEVHLIDDNLVAHSISRRYADRGNRFIKQKMKTKGISAEEHESAFEELPDELERAIAAGEKKLRSLKGLEPRAAAQKLYQHLALRGFGGSTVQKAVRQLIAENEALGLDGE
ncbi:MAG: regulatory protein RecX [Spirochaetes bacterium]|nr:regulatory protein RecX [Spirochaetota bacterium]MBX3721127.1 regulatory protein RecX [Turneriella sp.]